MNPSPINLPPVHPTKKISQSPITLPRVSLSPSPITTMTPNNMKKNIPVLAPLTKKIDDDKREVYVPPTSRSTVRPTTNRKGRPTTSKKGKKSGGRKMRTSRKRKSRKNKK